MNDFAVSQKPVVDPLKRALVIGGTSGYGKAIADLFRANAYGVTVASRRTVPALDVRSDKSVQAFFERSPVGKLDVIVYSAGVARGLRTVERGLPSEWRSVFETNALGVLRVAQFAARLLDRGGAFIHIGSIAFNLQYEGGVDYCASKAAASSILRGLRYEWLGTGVRVISIEPGLGNTDFQLNRYDGDREAAAKHSAGIRVLEPFDVATAAFYAANQPPHVNLDEIIIKPTEQATHGKNAKR
jgi:NADP-dependent 3-hydroxy acid dehydrogenase YdfG